MTDRYLPFRELARKLHLDAIALVPGANFERLYRKHFHQNERPLVIVIPQTGQPAAVVPNLELGSFELIGFEGKVFDWRDQIGYQDAFDQLMSLLPIRRLGVEGQVMRVFVHHAFKQAAPGIELIDAQVEIASLRLCKNAEEIALLEEAVRLSETALGNTLDCVKPGISETAVESRLLQQMFACGGSELSFSPIVAAGDNAARPHASARADYRIRAGDALLIDFGIRYQGLCADITRTFFVDHCADEHQALYETVLAANLAGHDIAGPAVSAHTVDDTVTRVLESSPFADNVRHKTGHGLGRDIHEDPYIMRGNHMLLQAGMVFTIEPGLYRAGSVGVRIEDDVLITDEGSRSLTSFDKRLTIL